MISVIIPTYNRASVLHKAVDSVLAQTYKDFELIIVDDGSTDNTKKVVKRYKDMRICYIYNDSENHGPSAARNIGINAAKGEYISFDDSDDEWSKDKLEKQLAFINVSMADVIFCTMHKKDGYIPSKDFTESDCNLKNELSGSFTGTPAYFGRSECFKETLFDESMTCNEDWELMIRLLDKYKVLFQRDSLVEVEISDNSVSSDINKALAAIDYILKKHEKLSNIYPASKRKLLLGRKYNAALAKDMEVHAKIKQANGAGFWVYINALYRKVVRYTYSIMMVLQDKMNKR